MVILFAACGNTATAAALVREDDGGLAKDACQFLIDLEGGSQ
jgi:hypothetical protein